MKYGARHLKRAIERVLVHPLSNLIATNQVQGGDLIHIDFDEEPGSLSFFKEAAGLEIQHMTAIVESSEGRSKKAAVVAASNRQPAPAARTTERG